MSFFVVILVGVITVIVWYFYTLWNKPPESKNQPSHYEESQSTMATLIGVLVDVSGPMKQSIGEMPNDINRARSSWARSIFKVVDGLIKHDVSSANHVFALGFGARKKPQAFDLLGTVAANTKPLPLHFRNKRKTEILEEIVNILENNGAPRVRKWAKMKVLLDEIERSQACSFLIELQDNTDFRYRFVHDCLPETCRTLTHSVGSYGKEAIYWTPQFIPDAQEVATRDSVKGVVEKGQALLSELLELVPIGQNAIMSVQKGSEILHGGIGEDELTDKRVDELMGAVEPLIHSYGGTPLMTTIDEAKNFFSTSDFKDHTKLLFIMSDGQAGDGNNPPIKELAQLDVTTVCCCITKDENCDPKHLYSTECGSWDEAAKLMFAMSSTITTQKIPRTIFVKRGWSIDITNNETRLFVQVNHPDLIDDVCDLARDVVSV